MTVEKFGSWKQANVLPCVDTEAVAPIPAALEAAVHGAEHVINLLLKISRLVTVFPDTQPLKPFRKERVDKYSIGVFPK